MLTSNLKMTNFPSGFITQDSHIFLSIFLYMMDSSHFLFLKDVILPFKGNLEVEESDKVLQQSFQPGAGVKIFAFHISI